MVLAGGIRDILCSAIIYVFGMVMFPMSFLTNHSEFAKMPLLQRLFYPGVVGFFTKFKYHFGWKCLDLSCLTSAAAFTGVEYSKDGKVIQIFWDRARNINSLKTAFPQNTGGLFYLFIYFFFFSFFCFVKSHTHTYTFTHTQIKK